MEMSSTIKRSISANTLSTSRKMVTSIDPNIKPQQSKVLPLDIFEFYYSIQK